MEHLDRRRKIRLLVEFKTAVPTAILDTVGIDAEGRFPV